MRNELPELPSDIARRHKLSTRMAWVLRLQAAGTITGLISISVWLENSREALRRRGLLENYEPTKAGWSLAAELFRRTPQDDEERGFAETCSHLSSPGVRLRQRLQ